MLDGVRLGTAPAQRGRARAAGPVVGDVILSSAIFPGWEGVNARLVAEEAFGVPDYVENDANLGALAEHRMGAGRGHDSSSS